MANDAGSDNPRPEDERTSQHPVDILIREIIRTRRPATDNEIEQIINRIADVPFNPDMVGVPRKHQGLRYQGRVVRKHDDSLFVHLVQRVLLEDQWKDGTSVEEYLGDLRAAILDTRARLLIYHRRGGSIAGVFVTNSVPIARRGRKHEPYLYVVYSADRGIIISGYQVSGVEQISISGEPLWLR